MISLEAIKREAPESDSPVKMARAASSRGSRRAILEPVASLRLSMSSCDTSRVMGIENKSPDLRRRVSRTLRKAEKRWRIVSAWIRLDVVVWCQDSRLVVGLVHESLEGRESTVTDEFQVT
jgi:hypothetical protein